MKRITVAAIFPFVAFAAALATSSFHDSMGVANAALLLAVIILVAATVDWVSGLTTAVVGAIALNYFHTEPVHSLRVTATSDVVAIALLSSLGIAASAATALRVSKRMGRYHASISRRGADSLTQRQPAPALWHSAVDVESTELALLDAHLVPAGTERLPVIARHTPELNEHSSAHGTVRIPASGAVVVLRDPRIHRDLVLTPRDATTSPEVRRTAVFMLADSIELSLSHPQEANGRMVG